MNSGKKRQSRRQRGNRVGKPIRAVIRQLSTRYAAMSTDLSLLFLITTAGRAFFIDIHPIDAHGDLPTRQCKAAVLQKTC
jgi:hypothetical protein